MNPYRGRLAPSPTGYLHLGHARTFWTAQERARSQNGALVLRMEDLDSGRSRREFAEAIVEDLRWFGFSWHEGPDVGGRYGPYSQSERRAHYLGALEKLRKSGMVFPCTCSRKDIQSAARAPHAGDDEEPIYPGTCRSKRESQIPNQHYSWRFRVPDGEAVGFVDGNFGAQKFVAGRDFGDFVIWRHDDLPSYQLAVVVDDAAMRITEVVRGADLLVSTARQLLLYRALGLAAPAFYHCPLMTDDGGVRLAKRRASLSMRALRDRGEVPEDLRRHWGDEAESDAA